ncbi:DUF6338 family protein [Oceanibacterium hippocampi]|uniref:Uncharacterized protein n=1 Tax=Oceanibacterium hippocampi TaxID=745714 RepID=A0A1Y5S777_9PROT|nr:DUF6338 family protein [Oceanibacterium hippocampi]SLN34007.1 hypothetical protein OCH7691_01317 [Oceanibacterium hippocampi]
MDIGSIDTLLLSLFLFLPGFLTASIQSVLKGSAPQTTGTWLATSVVRSLVYAAIGAALLPFISSVEIDFGLPLSKLGEQAGAITLADLITLLLLLYAIAVLWGIATVLARTRSFQEIAFLARLTPIRAETDVFNTLINDEYRDGKGDPPPPNATRAWLRVKESETRTILGRLAYTNVMIERDKPFEVYFDLAYEWSAAGARPITLAGTTGNDLVAYYIRVGTGQSVEFYRTTENWRP